MALFPNKAYAALGSLLVPALHTATTVAPAPAAVWNMFHTAAAPENVSHCEPLKLMLALPFSAFAVIVGRLPAADGKFLPFPFLSLTSVNAPDTMVVVLESYGASQLSVVVFVGVHRMDLLRCTKITGGTSRSDFPAAGLIHGGDRRNSLLLNSIDPARELLPVGVGCGHLANYEVNGTGVPSGFDLAVQLGQSGVVMERCLYQRFVSFD